VIVHPCNSLLSIFSFPRHSCFYWKGYRHRMAFYFMCWYLPIRYCNSNCSSAVWQFSWHCCLGGADDNVKIVISRLTAVLNVFSYRRKAKTHYERPLNDVSLYIVRWDCSTCIRHVMQTSATGHATNEHREYVTNYPQHRLQFRINAICYMTLIKMLGNWIFR